VDNWRFAIPANSLYNETESNGRLITSSPAGNQMFSTSRRFFPQIVHSFTNNLFLSLRREITVFAWLSDQKHQHAFFSETEWILLRPEPTGGFSP